MIGVLESMSIAALAAWGYLAFGRGGFWRTGEPLPPATDRGQPCPEVVAVVPARNEADVVGSSMASVFAQDYPGRLTVILVDDRSDDGTSASALAAARNANRRFEIVAGAPLPAGWVGKVWALAQGVRWAEDAAPNAAFIWFTDADIRHAPDELGRLVAKAETASLDLVSLMVKLHCRSLFERLLIPAFVFFFRMLYPFAWANDPAHRTAAAAGGSMLVRRAALARIGGIGAIRGELIDDCALAARIKPGAAIWVGLTESTHSLRPYRGLTAIWLMVARTAFRQLEYSWVLLAATVFALAVVYILPPVVIATSPLHGSTVALVAASAAYALMVWTYSPTLRLYGLGFARGALLPVAAFLYSLMTIDSARRYARGKGGGWKARHYSPEHGGAA